MTPRAKILNASAGSGKTYQLAFQYVRDVIDQPGRYRHILAVTFTNKATEEMKSRILREIHTLASGAESDYLRGPENLCEVLSLDERTVRKRAAEVRAKILHDYSRFAVLTIDTFFQRILRAFIKELGIDLDYNVEIETESVLSKSADALIEQITVDEELKRWMIAFVQERIDEGRRWDIRDGVLSLGGEIFKERNKEALANIGSRGELKEIVDRAVQRAEASKQRMRDTASRAVEIITTAGLTAADFSGKSRSFANYFFTVASGELKPYTATVAKMASTTEGWCAKGSPAGALVGQLQPLLREMCDTYDRSVRGWNTAALLRENYRSFALLSDLYEKVRELCEEQNTMLLPETKYILSAFIAHNDAPFIYEKVGNRFERFMIDEFQDTSAKEWENFLPLLLNAIAQSDDTSVLIVGDIKQSIYRWRGGDWKILHSEAAKALGEHNTQTRTLKENWRSLPTVVRFNNDVIGRIVDSDNRRLNETLAAALEQGDISESDAAAWRDTLSDAYRGHEQTPRRKAEYEGYVSVETFTERPPVVERICTLIDKGFRPCDIMILVRSATDGAHVAAELLDFKRRNDDPRYRFDVMTQEALVIGKAPVSSFIAAHLRLALNPGDTLSRAIFNRYLGRPFDRELSDDELAFLRSIRLLSPEEAFERIVIRHRLHDAPRETAYLQAIDEQIIAFCASKIADIALFLRWWDEQGATRSLSVDESATTVEISTIHKAKGLEKRVVIIPYCSWPLNPKSSGLQNIVWAEARGDECEGLGRFPVRYKSAMAASSFSAEYYREQVYTHVDNINLLYVALTRAAESLHIFIPERCERTVGELLLHSIGIEGDDALTGSLRGTYRIDETGQHFAFGEFSGPSAKGKKESEACHVTLEAYPTHRPELKLRLPSQRYFEETGNEGLSPRDFGILMHRAFERADGEAEILRAVGEMRSDGTLSEADAEALQQMIARALARLEVREWFGNGWDRIRNEQEIIIPGDDTIRRPDRVMTSGNRAVVVDYKFGVPKEEHRQQIRSYCRLLGGMGYPHTEGFLWYVSRGEIERVV